MMELAEFMLARAAEVETRARDVHDAYCTAVSQVAWGSRDYDADDCDCGMPERILAWCAAIRAIVAWAVANPLSCGDVHPGADIYHFDGHDHPVLLSLAQPYAAHPEFRPEWSPAETTHRTPG